MSQRIDAQERADLARSQIAARCIDSGASLEGRRIFNKDPALTALARWSAVSADPPTLDSWDAPESDRAALPAFSAADSHLP